MRNAERITGLALFLTMVLTGPVLSQQIGEWGDAPESAIAYPSLAVMGAFPTCQNVGPSAFVYHGPICGAWFGPSCDFEPDGNAGSCPLFAPYDLDECFADGDAGLMFPPAFTIAGGREVPCTGNAGSIGAICLQAMWGVNLDILVQNFMPNATMGYVNVLFDWDQNGAWAGASNCPQGPSPEHVLVDFPVPNGFAGPLSALMPPPFQLGPNNGWVWARFTISETPVGPGWNGAGIFEDGESEDYLLFVDATVPTEETSWGTLKSLYY
jgi:hypothetical protein